jgi:catechol 2,3-dioxygenase-like lactoylglutathione lyase family enzyme
MVDGASSPTRRLIMARITGAHAVIYSTDADADRAFFRDVLGFEHADAGGGWLIFRLPPAELAVHPANDNDAHELYLMCDDVRAMVAELETRGVRCTPVEQQSWGSLTRISLPGGGTLGVYEPRHPRPE